MTGSASSDDIPAAPSPFQGAINFRDLGGLPTRDGRRVRRGRLYRSDALWDLTDADVARLGGLGLRTVCDFRAQAERERWPNRLPSGAPPRVLGLGFTPTGTQQAWDAINQGTITPEEVQRYMHAHYRALATDHAAHYAALFEALLAQDGLPLLFHCASGKDRTGFAAAVILLALDVPREVILRDYVISDRNRRSLLHLFGPQANPASCEAVARADARYLTAALQAVDEGWGGAARYLREAMRLSAAGQDHLREQLLEPYRD